MDRRESPLPLAPLLADVLPAGSRLVTGIVILALSLVVGLRDVPQEPEVEAVPQPVLQRVVVGTPLPPLQAAVVHAPSASAPPRTAPRPATATRAMHATTARSTSRHRLHEFASAQTRRLVLGRRDRVAARRATASIVVARPGFPRSRAQVRREYLRLRQVVAATTGEDSGSFYLMRAAARHRTSRLSATHRQDRGTQVVSIDTSSHP